MESCARHEESIKNHEARISHLERENVGVNRDVKNLIAKLDGLIATNKWLVGILIANLLGFFFYIVQSMVYR